MKFLSFCHFNWFSSVSSCSVRLTVEVKHSSYQLKPMRRQAFLSVPLSLQRLLRNYSFWQSPELSLQYLSCCAEFIQIACDNGIVVSKQASFQFRTRRCALVTPLVRQLFIAIIINRLLTPCDASNEEKRVAALYSKQLRLIKFCILFFFPSFAARMWSNKCSLSPVHWLLVIRIHKMQS